MVAGETLAGDALSCPAKHFVIPSTARAVLVMSAIILFLFILATPRRIYDLRTLFLMVPRSPWLILFDAYTPLNAEKPPSTGITTPVTNSEAG
jgi:hypothetical protein